MVNHSSFEPHLQLSKVQSIRFAIPCDFQNRDYLVTNMLKGMGAIMNPPADLTAYFDVNMCNKVKQKLKKEQASLESHQASNLWRETFRYNCVMKLAKANTPMYHRETPRSAADASQAEAKAVKELVDLVSKGRSEENYRKHSRFWKFLYDLRVEATNNVSFLSQYTTYVNPKELTVFAPLSLGHARQLVKELRDECDDRYSDLCTYT